MRSQATKGAGSRFPCLLDAVGNRDDLPLRFRRSVICIANPFPLPVWEVLAAAEPATGVRSAEAVVVQVVVVVPGAWAVATDQSRRTFSRASDVLLQWMLCAMAALAQIRSRCFLYRWTLWFPAAAVRNTLLAVRGFRQFLLPAVRELPLLRLCAAGKGPMLAPCRVFLCGGLFRIR